MSLEEALNLYDDEDKGALAVEDLKEGLASVEIYDGKDKKSFECFSIYLLKKNQKSIQWVKIEDIMSVLFQNDNNHQI